MSERRRLAAIVAADVVGYSRLMGRDESGTLAALKEHRTVRLKSALARHRGRLVKLTGDGVLMEFPSAVDAVAAAIEFQQAMMDANRDRAPDTAIVFRIGVHLGDLIVDGDDLYGDGVNVVARLEGEAPAGGIVISGDVYNAVSGRLKATFEDLGNLILKNIERPVQAWRARWSAADWPTDAPAADATTAAHDAPLPLPSKPSIAVLPFQNMSGDPEQEYFTDGITEDIVTELSRFRSLFVVARNSSFSYKGNAIDARQVGQDLGVRYIAEGSIRRSGSRVRVAAQLIDTLTGHHIWAERYDRVLTDIFEVQDEVTKALVAAIAPQIETAELERTARKRPESLGAYELAIRAWAEARDAWTRTDETLIGRAIDTARRSLAIDASSELAMVSIGFSHWQRGLYHTPEEVLGDLNEGISLTTRAIELNPSNHLALTIRGMLRFRAGQRRAGLEDLREAHRINSNEAMTLMCLGFTEAFFGDPLKGIEHERAVLRLSPRDCWRPSMHLNLALSCFLAGQYDDGKEAASAATREAPGMASALHALALNLVGLGEVEAAKAAAESVRRMSPAYLDQRIAGQYPFERREDVQRATRFIRIAAGLEEPAVGTRATPSPAPPPRSDRGSAG